MGDEFGQLAAAKAVVARAPQMERQLLGAVEAIKPFSDLDELCQREAARVRADLADGALAAVSAFEPTGWSLVRFRLWGELRPELAREGRQLYQVGHVSLPRRTLPVSATA